MSAAAVKGRCPGALLPMASGDGLVVRIRPRLGRIDAVQAAGIAELSRRYGNGLIDLTSRANLQIRGVDEQGFPLLIEGLAQLGLLDPDPETEGRRNILVLPFWVPGDDVTSIADALARALAAGPAGLPAKFGFAVDCGNQRTLARDSADVRIERSDDGRLIVRADGAEFGRIVVREEAVAVALGLAEWFVASGGVEGRRGRMAAHIATGARPPASLRGQARPALAAFTPRPALVPQGALFAAAFGQMTHDTLRWLAGQTTGLRITPWRMMLAEGMGELPRREGLITLSDDARLRIIACSGAPRCCEAHADTRGLAAALAPRIAADVTLHISGCAKGCAHPGPASLTLVATNDGFDLVCDATARDVPFMRSVSAQRLVEDPAILGRA